MMIVYIRGLQGKDAGKAKRLRQFRFSTMPNSLCQGLQGKDAGKAKRLRQFHWHYKNQKNKECHQHSLIIIPLRIVTKKST